MVANPKPKPPAQKERRFNSGKDFEPTPEEIAEAARLIREVGYVFVDGQTREPWSEKRFGETATYEFPVVNSWAPRESVDK